MPVPSPLTPETPQPHAGGDIWGEQRSLQQHLKESEALPVWQREGFPSEEGKQLV